MHQVLHCTGVWLLGCLPQEHRKQNRDRNRLLMTFVSRNPPPRCYIKLFHCFFLRSLLFFLHVYSTLRLTSYCTHRMTPSCQVGGTKVWLGCGDRFVTKLLPETRWDVRFSVSMQSGRHMHRAVRMSQSLGLAAVSLFPGATSLNSSLKRPSLACYNPLVAANPEQRAAVEAIVSGVSRPAPVSILSTHLIRPICINFGKGSHHIKKADYLWTLSAKLMSSFVEYIVFLPTVHCTL